MGAKVRFREREVARVIRGVTRAGVVVGRVVIDHDGSIIVIAADEITEDVRPSDQMTPEAAA